MNKLDNKGFTLIELLAVLVILIAIMSIAIPTINSSLERSKSSQDKQRQKLLESAAELYVADHKNNMESYTCVSFETLKSNGYVNKDAINDSNGEPFEGCINFNSNGEYTYSTSCGVCK